MELAEYIKDIECRNVTKFNLLLISYDFLRSFNILSNSLWNFYKSLKAQINRFCTVTIFVNRIINIVDISE